MTEESPKPLDLALDLLVYVPVGLALTAAEELPRLAEKGRARVGNQISMARVVGQFAVNRGRQTVEKRFAGPAPSRPAAWSRPAPGPQPVVADGPGDGIGPDSPRPAPAASVDGPAPGRPPADRTAAAPAPAAPASVAGGLAIPGYDSLSASQVVQRLAGLSRDELGAVRTYEEAHRGRRTILNRIDQLQGH